MQWRPAYIFLKYECDLVHGRTAVSWSAMLYNFQLQNLTWRCRELIDLIIWSLHCIDLTVWFSFCSASVRPIRWQYVRLAYILHGLPYSLVVHVLLWVQSADRISRISCSYNMAIPWSGNPRWGCLGLISTSWARNRVSDNDRLNWDAMVW